jgi:hypothetical protein
MGGDVLPLVGDVVEEKDRCTFSFSCISFPKQCNELFIINENGFDPPCVKFVF